MGKGNPLLKLLWDERSMSGHLPLILTKLRPPKPKGLILRRDRLADIFRDNSDKRLILIYAGAGYGKTSLLLSLLNDLPHPFLWYNLDPRDKNPKVFFNYLIRGLRRLYGNFGSGLLSAIEHVKDIHKEIDKLVGAFANEVLSITDRHFYVVLDDYHHLEGCKLTITVMNSLLHYLPDNLHLIVLSRTKPSLSTARLWTRQDLLEITRDHLEFTSDEAHALFREVYRINISQEGLHRVMDCSEGWVVALQVIAEEAAASGTPERGIKECKHHHHRIHNYYESEVFNAQPKQIQRFMVKTSILNQISSDVANNILGISNSNQILSLLERKCLFITEVSGERGSYRYHPLFRRFLRAKLHEWYGEDGRLDLHLRAANYFEKVGEWQKAISHCMGSQLYQKAAEIMEKVAQDFINMGRHDVVRDWINGLPRDVIANHPWLMKYEADVLTAESEYDEALRLYDAAKELFEKTGDRRGLCATLAAMARITDYHGNYRKALDLAREALEFAGEEGSALACEILSIIGRAQYNLGNYREATRLLREALKSPEAFLDKRTAMQLRLNLGLIYAMRGDFHQTAEICQGIIREAGDQYIYELQTARSNLALCYMAFGDHLRAKSLLETAVQRSKMLNDRRGLAYQLHSLGVLYLHQGENERALCYFRRALDLNSQLRLADIYACVWASLGQLYLQQGHHRLAFKYVEEALSVSNRERRTEVNVSILITRGLIEMETGDYEPAQKSLNEALRITQANGMKYHRMRCYIYLARLFSKIQQQEGETVSIRRQIEGHLREGLKLALENDYHHFVIAESRRDTWLLEFALRNRIQPDYAACLLSEVDQPTGCFLSSHFDHVENKLYRTGTHISTRIRERGAGMPYVIPDAARWRPDPGVMLKHKAGPMRLEKKGHRPSHAQAYDVKAWLFGDFEVMIRGTRVMERAWCSRRAKTMFCYLLCHRRRRVSKDELMDLFWRKHDPSGAEHNLHTTVYYCRKALRTVGESGKGVRILLSEGHSYFLNPDYKYWLDTEEFERVMQEAMGAEAGEDVETLLVKFEKAIQLYRGEYLRDLYDSWCEEGRSYYKGMYVEALRKVADYHFKRSDYPSALLYYEKMLTEDEFLEEVHCQVMRCHAGMGNRKGIVQQYRRLEEILAESLNAKPLPQTTELYRNLMNGRSTI